MKVHTGDKLYKCHVYDKAFSTCKSGNVIAHVRVHTGAKPYSCRHCSDSFTRSRHLKAHLLKSHNEGTWLTCHICEKKFTHSGNLNRQCRVKGGNMNIGGNMNMVFLSMIFLLSFCVSFCICL